MEKPLEEDDKSASMQSEPTTETETASTRADVHPAEGYVFWFQCEDTSARAIQTNRGKWIMHHDAGEVKLLRLFFP